MDGVKNRTEYLNYRLWCSSWDIGGYESSECKMGQIPLCEGRVSDLPGFGDLEIVDIAAERILLKRYEGEVALYRGQTLTLCSEIDGYEDHDGVTWGGDNYTLNITWS